MATFDEWLTAYDAVFRALPAASDLACPNCGQRNLRIVFTARPAANAGYVSFWCDTCMEGIHVCRAPIPDGVTARPADKPTEERNPRVPDYRLVT
ncbi:hypothetical protein GAR06_01817 [Micromonospora saelicesensis]|nr:hypothetical protein GAR06_01817 [Micromonospora saelicesensis]